MFRPSAVIHFVTHFNPEFSVSPYEINAVWAFFYFRHFIFSNREITTTWYYVNSRRHVDSEKIRVPDGIYFLYSANWAIFYVCTFPFFLLFQFLPEVLRLWKPAVQCPGCCCPNEWNFQFSQICSKNKCPVIPSKCLSVLTLHWLA